MRHFYQSPPEFTQRCIGNQSRIIQTIYLNHQSLSRGLALPVRDCPSREHVNYFSTYDDDEDGDNDADDYYYYDHRVSILETDRRSTQIERFHTKLALQWEKKEKEYTSEQRCISLSLSIDHITWEMISTDCLQTPGVEPTTFSTWEECDELRAKWEFFFKSHGVKEFHVILFLFHLLPASI